MINLRTFVASVLLINEQMKTLERFISSSVTTIVLLLIYAFGLAIATFIEKYHGTAAAKAMIYYSPVFFLLQFLLVANFVAIVIKHQLLKRRRWGLMVTHAAFIVILLGALISHLFGEEGILHLREGEASDKYHDPYLGPDSLSYASF